MIVPSYEELLARCLDRVPSDIYKTEGSLVYDALAPACFELAVAYMEMESVLERTYADSSTGLDLTRRCAERGVYRLQPTYAMRKAIFNMAIPIGSRFALEDTTYIVKSQLADLAYMIQCEQAGTIGNIYSGQLKPLQVVDGLSSAILSDILIPGGNAEDDETLRKRYFDTIESEAYGGNVADYKQRTKQLAGVGGVKVYPVWNGGGTVKLVIISSDFTKPSTTLVNDVQTAIDPVQNQGKGVGIAPIGHVVTVQGVAETVVNIESNIALVNGYVWEDVKPYIETTISDYFKELSSTWDSESSIVVRVAYIESRILQVTGVLDVQTTKLNSSLTNLILGADYIPKLGVVTKA